MLKLISLIILTTFIPRACPVPDLYRKPELIRFGADAGYLAPTAMAQRAKAILEDGLPDEGTIREALDGEVLHRIGGGSWETVVYTSDGLNLVVKVPHRRPVVSLTESERTAFHKNTLFRLIDSILVKYLPDGLVLVVKNNLKRLLRLMKFDFSVLRRSSGEVPIGYYIGQSLPPEQIVPYRIIENLTIKVRGWFGREKVITVLEAIVQVKVDTFLIDEIERLAVEEELAAAYIRIDEALDVYQQLWRQGILRKDTNIFGNVALRRDRVCLYDLGDLFTGIELQQAIAVLEDLRYQAATILKWRLQRRGLPKELIEYFNQRANEVFTAENLEKHWQKDIPPAVSTAEGAVAGEPGEVSGRAGSAP